MPLGPFREAVPGVNAGVLSVVALTATDRLVAVDVGGFYRTPDNGTTWHEANIMKDPTAPPGTEYDDTNTQTPSYCLHRHPTLSNVVYAVNVRGLLKSTDRGRNWDYKWKPTFDENTTWGGFAISDADPNHLVIGRGSRLREGGVNGGRIRISPDGGENWSGPITLDTSPSPPYLEARSITFRRLNPNVFYVATNNGIFKVTVTSWTLPNPVLTVVRFDYTLPSSGPGSSKDCEWIGQNPQSSNQVWLVMRPTEVNPPEYNGGVLVSTSTDGDSWVPKMGGLPTVLPPDELASIYTMIAFRTAQEMYLGTDVPSDASAWGVWRTTDAGSSGWTHATQFVSQLDDPDSPRRIWKDSADQDRANSRFVALAIFDDIL